MAWLRREKAIYRGTALVKLTLLLLLGNKSFTNSQTVVVVNSCEDLKSTIEGAESSDEQLVVQLQEDNSQIVCREGIYIALGQSIRVEGVRDVEAPAEVFLDAEGIFDSSGDGDAVGILFENDGVLELDNLTFLLDYVPPEGETTSFDTNTNDILGVRIVQNSGAVTMTDCRIAGSRSVANQADVLGQAVNSEADSATVLVTGLTYDNLSPSGSVIRAIGIADVTVLDSSFYSGSDMEEPSGGYGSDASIIYCASGVELSVSDCTFESRPESISGGLSISSAGGTVQNSRFIGQYAPLEGSGAIYCEADSGSDRPLVIETSVFEGNIAVSSASSVAVHDRNTTIRGSTFSGNEGTPILFESSSLTGEHQLVVEDTEFTDNYLTTQGDLGSYNGGSAVVIRNTGGTTSEQSSVSSGSFTNTVCESNLPSTCEIVLDASQATLEGASTCLVCDGDVVEAPPSPAPETMPSAQPVVAPPSIPVLVPTPAPGGSFVATLSPTPSEGPLSPTSTMSPTLAGEPVSLPPSPTGTFAPLADGATRSPTLVAGTFAPLADGATRSPTLVAGTFAPLADGATRSPTLVAGTFGPLADGATRSPTLVAGTFAPLAYGATRSPTSSPTQSPTPAPAPVEDPVAACGSTIFTCGALKRAVEYDRGLTATCGFNLAINMTCSGAITVREGQDIEINGLLPTERVDRRRLLPSGSVGGANDSRSWLFTGNGCCADDDDEGSIALKSLFVVAAGGRLALIDLGFQDATTIANVRNTSVRAVHSSGELYVEGCDFVGPASTDVNERGGAIYSQGEILSISSSSFCNFTAWRSGGAVHATEAAAPTAGTTNVTILSTSFAKNGALSMIPGSGGGALTVAEGPALEVSGCRFEDNYGRLGAAVLCSGGVFDGSTFVGGTSQPEEQGNGGVRSFGGDLTVNNCTFVNITAASYASVAPGSALQVLDSNLTLTESSFEGCSGTPLFVETYSPADSPYGLQVETTTFYSNTVNDTEAAAAEISATNGTQIENRGGTELDMTCNGNVPSACEVVTSVSTLMFDTAVGCHVCDGEGVTAAGLDAATGEVTYTAQTGEELQSLIASGLSGTFRLVSDISFDETITISNGQTVTIVSGSSSSGTSRYSINPTAPFNGTNSMLNASEEESFSPAPSAAPTSSTLTPSASSTSSPTSITASPTLAPALAATGSPTSAPTLVPTASPSPTSSTTASPTSASMPTTGNALNVIESAAVSTTSLAGESGGSGSDSLFVVEPGGDLSFSSVVLNSTLESSGNGTTDGPVRAIYNGGNASADGCAFWGTGDSGIDGGAIYNSALASDLTITDSSFSDHAVTNCGGAIYAEGPSPVTLKRNTFLRNSAGASGGSVYAERGVPLEVVGGSFRQSSASQGAALASCGGSLSEVTIVGCATAEESNGAVVSGESGGGGACPSNLTVLSSVFEDNTGGGLAAFDTNARVTGSNFTGNSGTAAYFETGDGFEIQMEEVFFANNVNATDWADDSIAVDGAAGSDMVMTGNANSSAGVVGSTASLTAVTCATTAVSDCDVIVDEDNFFLSQEGVACGVCNLTSEVVDDSSNATEAPLEVSGDSSSGGWGWGRTLAVVLPIVLALLLCCCCVAVLYARKKDGPRPGTTRKKRRGRHRYYFNYPSMDKRWGWGDVVTPRPPSSSSGDSRDIMMPSRVEYSDLEYERIMMAQARAEAEAPPATVDVPSLLDADGTMILAESTIEASATSAAQRYELDRGAFDIEAAAAVGDTIGKDLLAQGETSVPMVSPSIATAAAASGAAMGAAAAAAGESPSTAAALAAGTTAAIAAEEAEAAAAAAEEDKPVMTAAAAGAAMGAAAAAAGESPSTAAAFAAGTTAAIAAEEGKPYVEDVNEEELWRGSGQQKRGAGGHHPTITPASSGAAVPTTTAGAGVEPLPRRSRVGYMGGPAEVAAMSESSSGSTALDDLQYGEDQGRGQGRILPGLDRFVHGKSEDEGEGYLESGETRR